MSNIIVPTRPRPPLEVQDDDIEEELFLPAPEMTDWLYKTFINDNATLRNPKHEHLLLAKIGCMWTNVPLRQGMLPVVGYAEVPQVQGNAWKRGRSDTALIQWFGFVPDFLITFYAPYVTSCDNLSFCATGEHELCHCAQEHSPDGEPRFKMDGTPKFGIRRHDVEEYTTIVDRYGVDAGAGDTVEFVKAANRAPSIGRAKVDAICGTCLRLAA